jgi:UDP-GlcNAc:undecaprenyl-phosphate/decaprenyl-phosphate GlcNAc-1-phosphate transferase
MIDLTKIFIASGFTALLSFSLTPFVIQIAQKYGLVDDTTKRSHPAQIHTGLIPRAGGIPIFLSILAGALMFIPMSKILVGILMGGALIILMGVLDDMFDLSPISRLIMSFGIVGLVILFGLGIPYVSSPLGGVIDLEKYKLTFDLFGRPRDFLILANLFSLIWIVGLMNFVSWSSGVDGQLPGFVGISSIFLGILAFRFSGHDISSDAVSLFAFVVGAAFLGFLPWHFYPQKIMPGYSGGALAGFLLGVLSILSWGKVGTLTLVLSVPLVDAMYIIIRRLKEKRSPMSNDAGHFHHRLMHIGWGKRRIAVFYWSVSFVFGVAAVYLHSSRKALALLIMIVLLAVFIAVTNRIKIRTQ